MGHRCALITSTMRHETQALRFAESSVGVPVKSTEYGFGVAAAIITSTALIVGLDAATATTKAIVGGLIIVALADNLTDSISIHLYQEAERLETRRAFRATLLNFGARLFVA